MTLNDVMETGRNQIFLSASKSHAHVFKQYIVQFAQEAAGSTLNHSLCATMAAEGQ